ncbi:UNVERIFIED_CONTAM: hypothetical protein Sradi_4141300 [Sesamum radiatum]|uniref:SWIM-type domain-containing protein n=1 Tax=Sesamum radiatum TaxID=300843 RepID=A0AAW2P320_SESRA
MTRLQTKKKGMEKFSEDVCPNVMKKINKQGKLVRHCYSRWCGANEFEVDHFLNKYVVALDKKTCTCGMFQLNAYPCCHAYAAIADRRDPVEVYIADCYKKDMYLKCYSHMIHAVPSQKEWVQTGCDPLMAPKIKKKERQTNQS